MCPKSRSIHPDFAMKAANEKTSELQSKVFLRFCGRFAFNVAFTYWTACTKATGTYGGAKQTRYTTSEHSMIHRSKFVLAVAAILACGTAQADIYSSDFESDNGGFAGTNDWEWGSPSGFAGRFSSTEPGSGHSGTRVWGTILGGNFSPSTVSSLSQTFDFTGASAITMTFWEWVDSGPNAFDRAKVFVNGNEEYWSDGDSGDAWRQVTLDLSAYDGLAVVTVDFNFSSSTVVERTGWYLDDVAIFSAIPEPSSMIVLVGLGAVASFVRRRRK